MHKIKSFLDFLASQEVPTQKRQEIEARLADVSLEEVFPGACAAFVLQDASLMEAYQACAVQEPEDYWGFLWRKLYCYY